MESPKDRILIEPCLPVIAPVIIQTSHGDAEAETRINLLNGDKEFVDSLRQNKRIWKIPWFILIMCSLQLVIAFCLETEQSHWKVAVIYVIGGISGSMATSCLQPQLSLMGASAGVYALLMSHIPHTLKNFHSLDHRYLRILALMILFLSDICFTTFHVLINHNTNPRICLEAHVAGAMAGLIMGFVIYNTLTKSSKR
ncbi:rhomboid-related protein 1 isoform X3 [Stomoxys calcitrans]|uniref:Peptidase S54 rhomboid domain-containing protein n=1 Tax=Stomoxys calcitrans TaxID=35570 RepID=A0A1I8NTU7_STOCA|nr:rhomboid-related protein 1 isoform X3 [Stomoxys calcitrans]